MDYRGQHALESHSNQHFVNFFSGPLSSNPTTGELMQSRAARLMHHTQSHHSAHHSHHVNSNVIHEEPRPMTSTIRRLRVRREEDHSHYNEALMRNQLMRRSNTENNTTQSPSSQMLESVFFSLMEQIQGTNEDEIKQELPVEMRDKVKRMKMGKSGQQCSVCYENFKRGCKIRKLPCKHIFHDRCIMPWLEKNSTCPNCRFDLFEFFTENPEGDY